MADELSRAWAPPPVLSLSEWANRYARLPAETSAEPGRWRPYPYQIGIMDAFTDPEVERITVMKSRRVGYTKIIDFAIGYSIHQDPASVLVVQPTVEDSQDYGKDELEPLFRDVPEVGRLVSEPKARNINNTVARKRFPGGQVILVGANAARSFRRVTAKRVFFDEVDGFPTKGAGVVDDLTGVLQAPGVTGSATGSWLSSESATRTPTDLTVSATLMQPKRHAALTSMSHQLRLQSLQAEGLVRQHLARLVGAAMDSGSLGGSGASGQPAGLLTVSGTQTQSGTTLNHAGVCNMLELSVTNGADDRNVAFVAVPTVRELLQTRERATGGGFAWDNNQVAGKPAYATVSMPAATAVCGDFANILIGLWNGGIELAVDPFTGFRSGVITLRAVLTMDCAILQPAAFCKTSSVT